MILNYGGWLALTGEGSYTKGEFFDGVRVVEHSGTQSGGAAAHQGRLAGD
jgi:hypothetical protein